MRLLTTLDRYQVLVAPSLKFGEVPLESLLSSFERFKQIRCGFGVATFQPVSFEQFLVMLDERSTKLDVASRVGDALIDCRDAAVRRHFMSRRGTSALFVKALSFGHCYIWISTIFHVASAK
jgi:hypothetical protein